MEVSSIKVLTVSTPGRYAAALFYEARRIGCLSDVSESFKKFCALLKKHQSIRYFLTCTSTREKDIDKSLAIIADNLSCCPVFANFMRVIGQNRQVNILHRINKIFEIMLAKYKNRRIVNVVSAVELLPEQKVSVEELLLKLFEEKCIIEYEIDKSIIGGIKIISEGKIFDASVACQLEQMKRYLCSISIGAI